MSFEWLRPPWKRKVSRRETLKAAVVGAGIVLVGCGRETSSSPDKRFITQAHWITDREGNITHQVGQKVTLGAELTLQQQNVGGIHTIDLTAHPYPESHPDPTFSPDGYPIVALGKVKVQNGILISQEDNPRVRIINTKIGTTAVYFTIPLDSPSDTSTPQPPIPTDKQIYFYLDVHGQEGKEYVDQLNVANTTFFTRRPNSTQS